MLRIYIDTSVIGGCLDEEFAEWSLKYLLDAQHIAMATLARVDVMVSWNFKHIVNLNRIRLYNSVNLKLGYPMIDIRSPREVLDEAL